MALKRDENRVPVIGGLSPLDNETPVSPYVDATTHRLYVEVQGEVATDAKLDDIITELQSLATSAKQDDTITELQKTRYYEYMGKQTVSSYTYFGFKERSSVEWKIMRKTDADASEWKYAYSEASSNNFATAWAAPASESYDLPPDS